jgi:hypothetical protein
VTFQILDLVLYGYNSQKRVVEFRPGQLNIITGGSDTGKTALIDIIDYCLGSDTCHIPDGKPIRKTVEWVGIKLKVIDGQVFISRKLPERGKSSSNDIYYEVSRNEIKIPEYIAIKPMINLDALKNLLSQHAGIGDNLNQPLPGQTRRPLAANIRHALFFSFQTQTELISNKHLFHNQTDPFVPQAIKDVLPYFLGAISEDHLGKVQNLKNYRDRLRSLERKLMEYDSIRGEGIGVSQKLLYNAKELGLIDFIDLPASLEDCVQLLKTIKPISDNLEEEITKQGTAINDLQKEREILTNKLVHIRDQLDAAKTMIRYKKGYSDEANIQLHRLKSVELFDQIHDDMICPICHGKLEKSIVPSIPDIKDSIETLDSNIRMVEERSPQMEKVILQLQDQLEGIKTKLNNNRELIESLQDSNQQIAYSNDQNIRRATLLGKINLYLESLPPSEDTSRIKQEIETLKNIINSLETETSFESIQEKLDSILWIIGKDMGKMGETLKLEHSENPLRLNIKHLTLIADTPDGPIPMDRMGGGKNWVGYHLITYFALHRWFVNEDRPVPHFIFLDQPSEVYFPEDSDWENKKSNNIDEDREAVKRMFKLAFDLVAELNNNSQIIITDHANIKEDWFQKSIIERWRDGKKLVPEEWIKAIQ